MKRLHYKAFISYSHQDEAWARWLQNGLERYRVPQRLVGTEGSFGPVPARLTPIFRDRADLSSSADLTQSVCQELTRSECLLVICSPAAARSRWVTEEILFFRSLGRAERIYCLLVAGDPQSTDPAEACFPPALMEAGAAAGHEPLAADARKFADGKRLARLKLVAGILGLRLDELRQRDMQRRRARWLLAGLSGALLVILTLTLAWSAISAKKDSRLRRANTEELLSYMLGNLKTLDPIVGLEVVDQNDAQVLAYMQSLGLAALDDKALEAAARTWREEGVDQHGRGELLSAMQSFQKSRAALIELHQRAGGTQQALFELGQAEFWVGYVYMDQGELDQAQNAFSRYGAITRRLVNADPNNAELVIELAYTLTNLSALERARQDPDTNKALRLAQSSMEYNRIALLLEPENAAYQQELTTTMAFLADAWLDICDLGKAIQWRQQTAEIAERLAQQSPADQRLKVEFAYALSGLATVQRQLSLNDAALASLRQSESLLGGAAQQERDSLSLSWQTLLRRQRIASLLSAMGELEQAWAISGPLAQDLSSLLDQGMNADFIAGVDYARFLVDRAVLAQRLGQVVLAAETLESAIGLLADVVRQKPQNRASRFALARALFEQWDRDGRLSTPADSELLEGFLQVREQVKSCDDSSLAARLAVMNGNLALARDYNDFLLGKGYFEPDYVRFCAQYGLCGGMPQTGPER